MSSKTARPEAEGEADAARRVIDFWFGAEGSATRDAVRKQWFAKDEAFDRSIFDEFGPLIERALRGELESWAAEPESALAQILLLDQMTRNAFRDTPRAFVGDARAFAEATALIGRRLDDKLPPLQRAFVYLPLEHQEAMSTQDEAVRRFTRLAAEDSRTADMLAYALRHRAVIAQFGRFPHRNPILGRQSTTEEIEFLKTPGSSF
ncbi:MAG: DUF924 domain-containing protein [Pseudomonadota bacterium]|nr:DUF924 domain-containing protein [Pseudomonadota bacterium]